jgi:DNA polymerase-3 subunit alpha
MAGRENGKYDNLEDFIRRTGGDVINKKTLEALIKSGAMDTMGERGQMLANVEKMSLFLKEIEHKNTTKQMDMFSLGDQTGGNGLVLESADPMSFESRIKEEKSVIGMSISGDPLDGLTRYIEKKSLGLEHVKKFLKELEDVVVEEISLEEIEGENSQIETIEKDEPQPREDERKTKPIVQIIGYVDSIRKIQTKK